LQIFHLNDEAMTIISPLNLVGHAMPISAAPVMPSMPAPESIAKFDALMLQPMATPNRIASSDVSSVIAAVTHDDDLMKRAFSQAQGLFAKNGDMSIAQSYLDFSKIEMEVSTAQVDFQVKMAVVQSSKSSAETLMKNQ